MGSFFRSEKMTLCQMFIQPEAAYTLISELGEAGVAQFRDLNPNMHAFQRKFTQEVRRCDEMERKLRYIEKVMKRNEILLAEINDNMPKVPHPREIINLEAQLERTESEILELSANEVNLKLSFQELKELQKVLEKTESFFLDQDEFNLDLMKTNFKLEDQAYFNGKLTFVAGVIQRERFFAFEMMLWRISHGNIFLRTAELNEGLEDPKTGHQIFKIVFVAFFQGEHLKSRIKRVCAGFHVSIYPCPNSQVERYEIMKSLKTRLEDLKLVLNQTNDHRKRVLVNVSKEIPNWIIMVKKMKAIYHTLNQLNVNVTQKCLIGECWVPTDDLHVVRKALANSSSEVGSPMLSFLNVVDTDEIPPTFNRTNRFTKGFQNLIDAYGVSSYREVNPALYTIITFPFLFAVMFGDVGHGIIMALFGGWMAVYEKTLNASKSTSEIWNIFFGGRYIILLMGLFSIYTGAVYNDVFSKSFNIFGSNWKINYNKSFVKENEELTLDPAKDLLESVYPFGMDPAWQLASNKIIFLNSYKMKLSIIFGVVHMIFAVCLSVVNHFHFQKRINIVLEFIPEIIFLLLLFGFMVFMMIFKWVTYSTLNNDMIYQPRCAPSVLIMFIGMVLFKENKPFKGCNEFMFTGQGIVQKVFVAAALVCIPWLLLGKPLYIMFTRKAKARLNTELEASPHLNHNDAISLAATNNDEPISEIFIHQAIHTIEYCLNTVSHTASYLRLWALSLAHSQLSDVLWNRVLKYGFMTSYAGSVSLFVIFAIWAFFTVAILVMMEGLSAFLHTLRLHWVEFMSKFYEGEGYAFQPFCFRTILESEEETIN